MTDPNAIYFCELCEAWDITVQKYGVCKKCAAEARKGREKEAWEVNENQNYRSNYF